MFSKKTVVIVFITILLAINIITLFFSNRRPDFGYGNEQVAISVATPFQKRAANSVRFIKSIWRHYFFLVSVAKENEKLKADLARSIELSNEYNEIKRSNDRLQELFRFKAEKIKNEDVIAARIVGKDPSPWFKSMIIDKGKKDGIQKGLPVVIPEGVVGVVTNAAPNYAKVLLITDQNSAVDVLVQKTRVRGIVKGVASVRFNLCSLDYILSRHDVYKGDALITSGLDGIFPKGLRVGSVSEVGGKSSGIFQEIKVKPYIEFETLEEVLVILNPSIHNFNDGK